MACYEWPFIAPSEAIRTYVARRRDYQCIRWSGRQHEVGVLAFPKLRWGRPFDLDIPIAPALKCPHDIELPVMFSSIRPQTSHKHHQVVQQVRHATLIRRPKRPYTFTQLITLSDGSTFLHRTTSPQSVYQTTKDTKNHILWNPSSQKLLGVEEDEAGRLRRFRERFGRGFDIDAQDDASGDAETVSINVLLKEQLERVANQYCCNRTKRRLTIPKRKAIGTRDCWT